MPIEKYKLKITSRRNEDAIDAAHKVHHWIKKIQSETKTKITSERDYDKKALKALQYKLRIWSKNPSLVKEAARQLRWHCKHIGATSRASVRLSCSMRMGQHPLDRRTQAKFDAVTTYLKQNGPASIREIEEALYWWPTKLKLAIRTHGLPSNMQMKRIKRDSYPRGKHWVQLIHLK